MLGRHSEIFLHESGEVEQFADFGALVEGERLIVIGVLLGPCRGEDVALQKFSRFRGFDFTVAQAEAAATEQPPEE